MSEQFLNGTSAQYRLCSANSMLALLSSREEEKSIPPQYRHYWTSHQSRSHHLQNQWGFTISPHTRPVCRNCHNFVYMLLIVLLTQTLQLLLNWRNQLRLMKFRTWYRILHLILVQLMSAAVHLLAVKYYPWVRLRSQKRNDLTRSNEID